MENEYLERIILMQKEQLDRYHEYMLCALSNVGSGNNKGGISNIQSNNDNIVPLFEFIESNLVEIDIERILKYLETMDHNGLIGLIEKVLCPDKNNLNFSLQSNQSFVKYKLPDQSFITENVSDFSSKVCMIIHEHCRPHVYDANEEDENATRKENGEDIVLDTLCDKNMQRVKNFTTLKFSDTQIRLIKKVFSGIKTK